MYKSILLVANLFWANFIFCQDYTSVIKGKITDKDSKQALVGVNITVPNSSPFIGITTDENGTFRLNGVKAGRINLKISYVGYEDATINQLLVGTGKETILNMELQEKVTNMNEVVINATKDKSRPNNTFASVSSRSFSVEETKRYAGTLNDPSRMVQTFAGVVSANDENNAIVVRGNSPRGLLWRMEGIEIPNPNHFAGSEGSTGGGVSILSSNMLSNTDFYSGAFPAEYGNALSGVFDLNLRKGNQDKWEESIQVGVLGLEAAVEGPFSKKYKGSYLVNYRYSTLDILSKIGLKIGGNQVPKYQDLSFNFYFPTKKIGDFTLFGIGGLSSLGNKAERDVSKWKSFNDRTEESLSQKTGVLGLTHTYHFLDNKTYLKTSLSVSSSSNSYNNDSLSNDFVKANLESARFTYVTSRVAFALNRKVDSKNTVRAGIEYAHIIYKLFNQEIDFQQQLINVRVNSSSQTDLLQGYWQWKHRFTDKINVVSGLHFTYSFINNKFYLEPRLGAEYRFLENQTLSAGVGLHSRIDAISTYVSQINPSLSQNLNQNRNLDFSRAFHAVIGYNLNFKKDFRLKAEVYYQYLFVVPVGTGAYAQYSALNNNEGFLSIPLKSKGKGMNYGIEITLEKFFTKNYYFLYTASFFNSQYTGSDNIWRSTAFNSNYVMNGLGGKEFIVGKRKINRIGVNAKILWRGGLRDTPIDLEASRQAGVTVYDFSKAYSIRLPDYFRVDFGASYRRNKKKYAWILALDIQNVINRLNVATKVYNKNTQQIETKKNLGIIPVLSYKVEF